MAQSVELRTSAQVMISRFMSSSPASGSALTAWSLEPGSDSVSPLSVPPLLALCLSLSKINIKNNPNIQNLGGLSPGFFGQGKLAALITE